MNIPLSEVFKTPNFRQLADHIKRKEKVVDINPAGDDRLVLLKQGKSKENHLFFIHSRVMSK